MSDATRDSATPGSAVLLLSGGLDSTTLLALATRDGYSVHALTFQYGQRHSVEVAAATAAATRYCVASHRVIDIDLRSFGGSALTTDAEVPRGRDLEDLSGPAIPATYVPARNTIFLSYALAYAEVTAARDIFIGVNALDFSGYPDCRPEYIAAFEQMANLATRAGVEGTAPVRIRAPLMHMGKAEIIALGASLGVDYGSTTSCYDPGKAGEACGECDACQLRLRGFAQAGLRDPVAYAASAQP